SVLERSVPAPGKTAGPDAHGFGALESEHDRDAPQESRFRRPSDLRQDSCGTLAAGVAAAARSVGNAAAALLGDAQGYAAHRHPGTRPGQWGVVRGGQRTVGGKSAPLSPDASWRQFPVAGLAGLSGVRLCLVRTAALWQELCWSRGSAHGLVSVCGSNAGATDTGRPTVLCCQADP